MKARGRIVMSIAWLGAIFLCSPAAGASTFKSGPVTYVTSTGQIGSTGSAEFSATCPSPRRASSVGASIAGHVSDLFLGDTDLDAAPDDIASAGLVNDSSSSKTGHVTAVCLGAPFASKLVYSQALSTVGAGNIGTGTSITCSAANTRIAGLGFGISGPLSEAQTNQLGLQFTGKALQQNSASLSFNKSSGSKNYTTQASCLPTAGTKLALRKKAAVGYPGLPLTLKAKCPKHSRVIGGGEQGFGQIQASAPYDSSDKGKTPEDGWRVRVNSFGLSGYAAEAICLRKS